VKLYLLLIVEPFGKFKMTQLCSDVKIKMLFYLAICHLLARLVKKIDGITKTGEVFAKYLTTYLKKEVP
jgi:hypothetical protein